MSPFLGAHMSVAGGLPLAVERQPMGFELGRGLYWRLEESGLLFGWSDPDEKPGEARSIDLEQLARIRERLGELIPVTRPLGLRKIQAEVLDNLKKEVEKG